MFFRTVWLHGDCTMFTTWIPPRLKALFRLRKPLRAKLHDVFRPRLEALEDRVLLTVRTRTVAQGGTLELRGVLSGSGGITKTGQGTLTFGAASANAYSGETTVVGGLLQLDNGTSAGPAVAIPGSLTISSPVSSGKIL